MKRYLVFSVAGAGLAVLLPSIARAQEAPMAERPYLQQRVPAPSSALELTVGTGYTQPFGLLRSGVGFPDVAREGIGVDLGVGYRVDPHWGVSIGGQYQELNAQNADASRGVSGTIAAQYHIAPNLRLDPWLELGVGYRALWQVEPSPLPTVLSHGLQLGRARAGLDVRVSPDVSIAPVIGADATMFLWQDAGTSTAISNPTLSTFVFAGIQGRVDVGGTAVGTASVTSAQPED